MDDSLIGIVSLVVISVSFATVVHLRVNNYWSATFISALLSVVMLQVVFYIELGYLDPFFLIAIAISGIVALIISALVGILIKAFRKKISNVQ